MGVLQSSGLMMRYSSNRFIFIYLTAMSKKENIRSLWRECFRDSDEYLDMYFDRIYRDSDAETVESDGKTVSTLLSQPYQFLFNGKELPATYLAGAATRRSARGRGHMTHLVEEAILRSAEKGDLLCALIPSHDWLYFYFDRFGFATVFLTDTQRFTSCHPFSSASGIEYKIVDDPYSDAVMEAIERFERQRPGGILHSRRDLINLLDDYAMRPDGTFIAVGRGDCSVAAMVWAYGAGEILQVNELLGVDDDARQAAMRALRQRFPDRPMRFLAPADSPGHRHLYARGMARIADARLCLETVASANPDWRSTIRIHDPLVEKNNRTFRIAHGRCELTEQDGAERLDLDVDITVLAKILFSAPPTGQLVGIPSARTHISLMPH